MANKGTPFEREICKLLSLWWSGGTRDDIFWRTDNSGGRAKFRKRRQNKDTYGQSGDIQAVDPIGQPLLDAFTCELKRGYSKYTITDMLDKRPRMAIQQWEKHVRQAHTDSKNAGSKYWMLISRRDRREALADIPLSAARRLERNGSKIFQFPHMECYLELKNGRRVAVLSMRLCDFLKSTEPCHIMNIGEIG